MAASPPFSGNVAVPRRRVLTLALLTFAYFFSFMDRQILAILQELIRADLHLNDTELGLLAGFAFAVFYATLGIPVARLADRGHRVTIIALALSLWSLMTALGGLAMNFGQLLAARIGVGVGEAGSSPPSHSMIADLYPPEKRAGAMAVYSLGVVLGAAFGTIIGGAVGHAYGWRAAMFTVGLPGLVLALVIRLVVPEPVRGGSEPARQAASAAERAPTLGEGLASMWRDRAARHLVIGVTLISFIGYGHGAFGPSFMQRSLGITLMQIVTIIAPVQAIIAATSALIGGRIANGLAKRLGLYAQAYMLLALGLVGILPYAVFYLVPNTNFAVGGYFVALVFVSSFLGPSFALIQDRAPIRQRALWAAVTLLSINLIGLGLGPTLIGVLSDLLRPSFGAESLRYAMVIFTFLSPWPLFHYWRAGLLLRREKIAATGYVL